MKVFVTGATGFIGTALIPLLKAAGHEVVGLARNAVGAAKLERLGVGVHHGSLEDPESLAAGAAASDGVIHLAFDHDFANFMQSGQKDLDAVQAMTAALEGTGKPFLLTSGTALTPPGKIGVETDRVQLEGFAGVRGRSEIAALEAAERGVRAIVMRLSQIHDTRRQGLITPMIQVAREKGYVAYVNEGRNGFPAAHLSDAARLYSLALEKGKAGDVFHAVDEEHVPMRAMAEAIGAGLALPVRSIAPEAVPDYFGPFAFFAMIDNQASSAITREQLGWTPKGRGIVEDLRECEPDAAV